MFRAIPQEPPLSIMNAMHRDTISLNNVNIHFNVAHSDRLAWVRKNLTFTLHWSDRTQSEWHAIHVDHWQVRS